MRSFPRVSSVVCAALFAMIHSALAEQVYVGTYTHFFGAKGIYHYHLDPATGTLSGGELAAKTSNPSFLAVRPGGHFLYAVNENDNGSVSAFSIGANGSLTLLNQKPSNGASPCHIFVDRSGRHALIANYTSGSAEVYAIQPDGSLGKMTAFQEFHGSSVNRDRQMEPHPHSIYLDPSGQYAYVPDLGTDQIHGFRFDPANGTLTPDKSATSSVAPGSGPRHLVFHPHRDFVYVVSEMGETITAFSRNPSHGTLLRFQVVSALPADFHGDTTAAEIAVHPTGRFLYCSNRGHDSVTVLSIAPNGRLTPVDYTKTGGRIPRSFALDPTGKWLLAANQKSNSVFVFKIDQKTGKLTPTGQSVKIPSPVCVLFP